MFSKNKNGQVHEAVFSRQTEVRRVDFAALRSPAATHEVSIGDEGSFVGEFESPRTPLEEIEEIQREAYERGLKDGKALVEDLKKVSEAEEFALEKVLMQKLVTFIDEISDQSEEAVVHLSRAFAEAILERELELPETFVHITRAAVQRACGLDTIHIYVVPSAVQILENHIHMLRPDDPAGESLKIHPDPRIARGDIRIVSEGGHIEGILQDRLDRLVESAFVSISEASMGE